MPRRPRRAKTRSGLTVSQREDLLDGVTVLDFGVSPFASKLERRALWYAYRAELLAEWDAQEHPPLTRPAAMIDYELVPKFPRIDGESEAAYLVRIGEATPIERGHYEAEQRDEAEHEERFRRACDEYTAENAERRAGRDSDQRTHRRAPT